MPFLLSCISTKHSMLKKHWATSREQTECPLTVLGSRQKPKEDQGGLLCLLDDTGDVQELAELPMPAGMAHSDKGILVASIDAVHEVSNDLTAVQEKVSLPAFNMLHSLSRSQRGYLVASTGLDAVLEFTHEGELLWSWWAIEHGFTLTPTGEPRYLDISADHRGVKYGTLAHTTHVNSAAELPDGTVLASLFHQGMVIAIDRESGEWKPVLEGLDHPHSVRVLAEDYITVADTARGRALMVRIKDGKGSIEAEATADTNWLQDCLYDYRNDQWVLVDGKNSRVILQSGSTGKKELARFELNPEWRLYGVLPLA
ncbi:hypothetical protein EPA93_38680 [Ktedonosporobacter rubrisoli]|uniref:WD40 repeat domain-containing protein n=1 Tax=Ktedonosporobacter rubrisoli TaxID=2509675 RepID=A0A4P6K188_KTERU|nr:hypothetical protein [Ktedonosporobacter rubrisoli]QBD81582.1 hypothetical protein EPA93_38680 [Ktedonosporobacter rubrisoli]